MNVQSENVLLDRLQNASVSDRDPILRSAGQPSDVVPRLVEAASAMTWVDARRAMPATEVVLQLADQYGSTVDRTRARWARGRALAHGGRFNESIDICREGISTAEQAGLAIEAARLRVVLMQPLAELGLLNDAIAVGQTARQMFVEHGEDSLAARADINLGGVHQRRDQPAIALRHFDRAKPFLMDEPLILGHLENNRGEALLGLNDFHGSELAYGAALEAFARADANLPAAIAEGNLAELAARQGQLQKSLLHFERARRAFEADKAPGHLARLRAEQADAMNVLGLPRDAAAAYVSALAQLDQCGLALEAAKARAGLGTALLRLNRGTEAETALAAAATAFEELGHRTARAKVDLVRAELAIRNGRLNESQRLALQALSSFHDRPAEAVAARFLLGRIATENGKLEQADAELGVALAMAREFDIAPLLADVLHTRGLLRRRQARFDEAVADFSASIDQAERVRGALQAERFRAAYLGDRSATFEWLVATLLDARADGHVERAFAAAERAKSRSLIEQTRRAMGSNLQDVAGKANSLDEPLINEIEHVRGQLSALYSRLGDDGPQSEMSERNKAWRAAVTSCERRMDELQSRLETTQGVGNLFAPTIALDQVQARLKADQALIAYYMAGDELLAFIVRDSQVHVARFLGDLPDLARRQQNLQFQINRALRPGALSGSRAQRLIDDAQHELKALHDMLIAPIQAKISDARRLTIVPHGSLHLLPFQALWDGQQYLVEQFAINFAPSTSLLIHLQEKSTERLLTTDNPVALVVGVADTNAPQIADEAKAVVEALSDISTGMLIGPDATVESFCNAAPSANLLHLACHGRFSADTPLGSGLKLADRWLTVRDIYSLKLKASLVTLSGCETGLNLVTAGDELMGLLRGFFAAGAESLLVSLWRVDDAVTREFMSDFYRSLNTEAGSRRTKTDIHAQTQRKFMDRYQHPALWAPFILEGRE